MATTWSCPACQRRVPLSLPVCRCGASRSEAMATDALREAAGSPRDFKVNRRDEPLPWEVKGFFVLAVALVAGAAWVTFVKPAPREPMPPLLGWTDPPRASPSPYFASPKPGSAR